MSDPAEVTEEVERKGIRSILEFRDHSPPSYLPLPSCDLSSLLCCPQPLLCLPSHCPFVSGCFCTHTWKYIKFHSSVLFLGNYPQCCWWWCFGQGGQCLWEGWIRCLYSPKVVKLPLGLPIELSPAGFNKREGIVKETELTLFTFGALREQTLRPFFLVVKKTVSQ